MMHELVTISHEWKSCQSMEILSQSFTFSDVTHFEKISSPKKVISCVRPELTHTANTPENNNLVFTLCRTDNTVPHYLLDLGVEKIFRRTYLQGNSNELLIATRFVYW